MRAAVEGVRDHPPRGDPGRERPLQHAFGQLYLVAEGDPLGDAGLRSSDGIARPSLRQVQGPIDESGALLGGVGQEHADLAIDRVARGAGVLAGNTYALLALLQEAGFVHDEDARPLVTEVLDDVLSKIVADLIGVPLGGVQEALDALGIPLPDGLGKPPAVLALDLTEQAEEIPTHTLPGLRTGEAVAYSLVQRAQRLRPPANGG